MTVALAAIVAYAIGSLPTANGLARLAGVDLLTDGSRNPGANNARRLGGNALGGAVLAMEILKGAGAVLLGEALAGDPGAAVAAVAAVTGNVFSIWYGLGGGKGLGITLGVLVTAWPVVALGGLIVVGGLVALTRSSGTAALGALVSVMAASLLWGPLQAPTLWGIGDRALLPWVGLGLVIVMTPRHLRDARSQPLSHDVHRG